MKSGFDQKTHILESACRIVGRAGASHLTIDAVAAEAGLSKGGVLYHYPNKRSMLEGMLESVISRNRERSNRYLAESANEPAALLPVQIKAESEQTADERAMSLAILATAAEDPELLNPARSFLKQLFKDIQAQPGDTELALILLLASEGMRFLGMLNLLPLSARQHKQLDRRLLEMAVQASE